MSRTELSAFGEFGLIDKITHGFENKNSSSVLGIGDDAAVLGTGDQVQLVTKDLLLEGIHFDLSYVPLKHLGYKAVAVNVSDIAAMNGKPEQILIGLGVSNRFSLEALEELYIGIKIACDNYGVDLIGGDTTASSSGLVISVTAIGSADKDKVTKRSGANEGDVVCVTGDIGGAYIGLQLLEREKQVFLADPEMQPDLEGYDYVVGRQLRPEARMDVIHELKERNIVPTSMIDISDGLASELHHIGKQSNVGFEIFTSDVPIVEETKKAAMDFNISPDTCAFNGGEDYELLFTLPLSDFEKIRDELDVSGVGKVVKADQGINIVTKAGTKVPIKAQGWDHFDGEGAE